ncbi:MAG: hypothetical protein H6945_01255 [Zoogloeaceae bacterium]|nr:hypothetical protein [Rhodocyclaceae bacterium]MCP5234353.1 hypothetical protein [Zoogloeaceae bacterium]
MTFEARSCTPVDKSCCRALRIATESAAARSDDAPIRQREWLSDAPLRAIVRCIFAVAPYPRLVWISMWKTTGLSGYSPVAAAFFLL